MTRIRIVHVLPRLALVAALVAAGCAGKTKTTYFTLGAIDPAGTPALATRPELGLAVGPVEFPRYLERREIVTRDGAHRLVLSNANRWGGSLRSEVPGVLSDDLGRLLGTERIVVFPNEPRFRLDYRVLVDVREFEGVLGEAATLRARWTIVSGADGRALAVEEAHVVEATASPSFEDLVAAQREALRRLGEAIAARLVALPVPAAGAR